MKLIEHADDECCGSWRLIYNGPGAGQTIDCDGCGATYPSTQANRWAAIEENYAGIYLRRLTREGQAKL